MRGRQPSGTPHVVLEMGVAAIDDHVASAEQLPEHFTVDSVARPPDHDPGGARRRQLGDAFSGSQRRWRPPRPAPPPPLVEVVDHAGVAAAHKRRTMLAPIRRAHHPQLHRRLRQAGQSNSGLRRPRCLRIRSARVAPVSSHRPETWKTSCYDPAGKNVRIVTSEGATGMGRLDAVIRRFMPREERFHELLSEDTQNLTRAARLFASIARSTSLEDRRVKLTELKALEHFGDQTTRRIFDALNSTFITPLDREDIHSIATNLDDVLDFLESVAQNLVLFELAESPEALRQFADIVVEMVEEIDRITAMLWNLSRAGASRSRWGVSSSRPRRPLYAALIADLSSQAGRRSRSQVERGTTG